MDGRFLHSGCAFYAWSCKGRLQHCGQCCCLHGIFNLFTECTHPFLVIRVCTALLQFRVSIKFRDMSSFPPSPRYSKKFNVEQRSNQIPYLLHVRCFHVVWSTADHLKYLLPQLLPILIPNTFSLLGTVHQNSADKLALCDLFFKKKKRRENCF